MLRPRIVELSWRARVVLSLLFWLAVAWLAWLDGRIVVHAQHADIVGGIISAFSLIWDGLQAAEAAVVAFLEGVVAYLVAAVAWLYGVMASFVVAVGAIFSKVWDALRVVWTDVLKPALVWVDQQFVRLQAWLKDTFSPVFNFLARVRDELMAVYKRFVQPIIDTIEFLRALNRVLLVFHIDFLKRLDVVLQQIEQRIEEPILWLNAKLNEIWNALDLVVTADGFFQRLTLVRSLSRYRGPWTNGFWNSQIDKNVQSGDDYSRGRMYPLDAPWANGKELGQFYRAEGSRMDARVAELVPVWRQAAGIDPPGPDDS